MNTQLEEYAIIENRFGVPGNFIDANTRNKCSEDMVSIIRDIANILYPNDGYDVYLLPSEAGSYKDIIKFVKRNKVGSTIGVALAVSTVTIQYLNYKDTHASHLSTEDNKLLDTSLKCLELQEKLNALNQDYDVNGIPNSKLQEICDDLSISKRKSSFYRNLDSDRMVLSNQTSVKNSANQCVVSNQIERAEFKDYILPIIDTKYSSHGNGGIIELVSPVVRQSKEGKGIPWKGVYYGDGLTQNNITILEDGDNIEFYMQDSDFKAQISSKIRTFAVKDNMKVLFDVTGEIKGDSLINKSIYVKEVTSYNDDIVFHKERVAQRKELARTGQDSSLFDDIEQE